MDRFFGDFDSAMFSIIMAILLALLEIEVEGKEGWAYATATWYRVRKVGWVRVVSFMLGGKPVTGYHVIANIMVVLIFMGFMIAAARPAGVTFGDFAHQTARYMVFVPVWDYLWFVYNPAFAGRISPRYIWWHRDLPFVGVIPMPHVMALCFSVPLAALDGAAREQLGFVILHVIAVMISFVLAPRYHAFKARMHSVDERHLIDKGDHRLL